MSLRFIENGSSLAITDLRSEKSYQASLDEEGRVEFTIEKPGDFLFLRYHSK